jgi:hypothetical protein
MIRVFREAFKTSCFTRGLALWTLATKDHDATIGIFNEKEDNPESWIAAICQVVENSILFQVLWREMIPKGIGFWDRDRGISPGKKLKWGGTGVLFERGTHGVSELSIEPHGVGGAATGKHFTHKILDDIIGLKAKDSPAVMEAAVEWVDHARALERPLEGGCEIINHTTWTHADVYRHIETKWPGEYLIYTRALLENPDTGEPDDVGGISTFPEKIPTSKAYRMKEADPYVFSAQYQVHPKAGRDQSFSDTWDGHFHLAHQGQEPFIFITRTGGHDSFQPQIFDLECGEEFALQLFPLVQCEKAIILDPAPSKQAEVRRDPKARNGIVVVAIDPWGRRFCLEALATRDGPTEVLELLISLYRKWAGRRIAIEEVNFSALYQPLWGRILELDPRYADVRPEFAATYPRGRDKIQRIRDNLIPIHENFLWHYNTGRPGNGRGLTGPEGPVSVRTRTGDPGIQRGDHGRFMKAGPVAYILKEKGEFPYGETIDLLDALSYTDEILVRPPTEIEERRSRSRSRGEYRGVTGYGF